MNLTPGHNIGEQLCANKILFLSLLWNFQGWTVLSWKQAGISQYLLRFPLSVLLTLFKIFIEGFAEWTRQNGICLLCAEVKRSHLQTSGALGKYILIREIHSKAPLSRIYKMNYFLKSHCPSKSLLEICVRPLGVSLTMQMMNQGTRNISMDLVCINYL